MVAKRGRLGRWIQIHKKRVAWYARWNREDSGLACDNPIRAAADGVRAITAPSPKCGQKAEGAFS